MRFKGFDLNLLVAFEALMETRSVSRAADKLHLTQPALSAALGRLRQYFSDDLLVSHGKRMLPTAHAESLRPWVQECLRTAESLIRTNSAFDPVTSQRTFRIIASDYAIAAVLTPLVRRLAKTAPHVRLEFVLPSDDSARSLDEGSVDLLLTPETMVLSHHPSDFVFDERHVVVGSVDNPLLGGPISEADFFDAPHVTVGLGRSGHTSFADEQIDAIGGHRRIAVIVPSFTLLPWMVMGTDRLTVMHERLARTVVTRFPLASQPLPFDIAPLREFAQFHTARSGDEGLRWLLVQLRLIGEDTQTVADMAIAPSS